LRVLNIAAYNQLWRARSYRRRVGVTVLAFFGATATVGQLVLWLVGLSGGSALTVSVAVLAPVGVLVALASALPKGDVTARHPQIKNSLRIRIGDLLETSGAAVVLTMNRRFDTAADWVAEESLISQFAKRFRADGTVSQLLSGPLFNRSEDAPIGAVVPFRTPDTSYLFLAVTSRGSESRSVVVIDEIWTALNSLWQYARRNDLTRLTVPVIGGGFARAQVGATLLVNLMLASYTMASMEMPVADLDLVMYPAEVNYELLEFARAYTELLGYKVINSAAMSVRQVDRTRELLENYESLPSAPLDFGGVEHRL
jgi:HAMP domain-containing protein